MTERLGDILKRLSIALPLRISGRHVWPAAGVVVDATGADVLSVDPSGQLALVADAIALAATIARYLNEAATDPVEMPAETIEAMVAGRGATHGSFADNARISQVLKEAFRAEPSWAQLNAVQREALDLIALKLARVLTVGAGRRDNWDDIAGYAVLVARDLMRTGAHA